jgi:Glyoxalase-like domain
MDIDGGDVDEYLDNDVHLDDNVLDHIVLAAPDLEKAMEQFHEMTGIMPTHVGPLQGLGAKTAHVGLDNNRYIEILAPDSEDPGPLGDELKALKDNTLTPYHYAIRSSEVSRLIEGYVYDVLGWDPDHIAMVQALPDDTVRQWDLLTMYGHDVGGVAPYYVRWVDPTHHPTAKIPLNATLLSCRVVAPEDHDVHKLITGVGGIDIETGDPTLECTIETPKGNVIFSAKTPKGLVFPGYDDEYQ